MASPGIADDGSIADIPWASAFDPDHNARALNAIQARGFRAATDVIERLLNLVERDGVATADPSPSSTEKVNGLSALPPVEDAVAAWQSALVQLVQSLSGGSTLPGGAVKLDLRQGNSREIVYLESLPSGVASTEVWLHNGGPGDLGDVCLRCSDLLAHDGDLVPSATVRLDPETVAMPDRCSRGVTVRIEVADDVRPGRYRGTLLADAHPDVWLPVQLTVLSESE
ncbi:MAG: hypothetical protein WAM92_16900 [Mycobacterium sp.]